MSKIWHGILRLIHVVFATFTELFFAIIIAVSCHYLFFFLIWYCVFLFRIKAQAYILFVNLNILAVDINILFQNRLPLALLDIIAFSCHYNFIIHFRLILLLKTFTSVKNEIIVLSIFHWNALALNIFFGKNIN